MLPEVIFLLPSFGPIPDVVDIPGSKAVLVEVVLDILMQFATVEAF